jgi:hypothetical protein
MAKTNAEGVPSYIDARGTDETARSADGSVHYLDPTASVQDGELKDNPDLKIDGDDAELFETREERDQRELRGRETSEVKSSAGTSSKESSKPLGKNAPKN